MLIGALTALTALIYGGLTLTLGVDAPVSVLALREVLVQGFLGVLLAIPVFPLIKRILRPALVDDATRARSRASAARRRVERTARVRDDERPGKLVTI